MLSELAALFSLALPYLVLHEKDTVFFWSNEVLAYSFNKYRLCAFCLAGAVLGALGTAGNKAECYAPGVDLLVSAGTASSGLERGQMSRVLGATLRTLDLKSE